MISESVTDNLIPNGNFDEGQVKWTPAEAIKEVNNPQSGKNALSLGGNSNITSCSHHSTGADIAVQRVSAYSSSAY